MVDRVVSLELRIRLTLMVDQFGPNGRVACPVQQSCVLDDPIPGLSTGMGKYVNDTFVLWEIEKLSLTRNNQSPKWDFNYQGKLNWSSAGA